MKEIWSIIPLGLVVVIITSLNVVVAIPTLDVVVVIPSLDIMMVVKCSLINSE